MSNNKSSFASPDDQNTVDERHLGLADRIVAAKSEGAKTFTRRAAVDGSSDEPLSKVLEARETPKRLFVSGNIQDRKETTTQFSLYLRKSLNKRISDSCQGGRNVVLNKLIELGLDAIEKQNEKMYVEAHEKPEQDKL